MSDIAKSMRGLLAAGDQGAFLTREEMAKIVRMGDDIEQLRAALEMVLSRLHSGDDSPDEAWADFSGSDVQMISDALI